MIDQIFSCRVNIRFIKKIQNLLLHHFTIPRLAMEARSELKRKQVFASHFVCTFALNQHLSVGVEREKFSIIFGILRSRIPVLHLGAKMTLGVIYFYIK